MLQRGTFFIYFVAEKYNTALWLHQSSFLPPTCSSSLPDPRFSTSISKQRDRKARKTGESFSGLWSSGVPLVAIKYSAYKMQNTVIYSCFISTRTLILLRNFKNLNIKCSPWEGSHWDREALLPPSLSPWCQETRYPLLVHTPSWSQPQGPSSTACPPWCCVCSALGWSGRRSRSQLRNEKNPPLIQTEHKKVKTARRCLVRRSSVFWVLLSFTDPSIPSNTLSLLMSLWMTWLAWRNSSAWSTWSPRRKERQVRIHTRLKKHFFAFSNPRSNPQRTSRQTAAIWASSMHVSVTTSVREPPARYSITTKSSSPTR